VRSAPRADFAPRVYFSQSRGAPRGAPRGATRSLERGVVRR